MKQWHQWVNKSASADVGGAHFQLEPVACFATKGQGVLKVVHGLVDIPDGLRQIGSLGTTAVSRQKEFWLKSFRQLIERSKHCESRRHI